MAFQNIVKKVTTAAAFILIAGGITCFPVSAAQSGYQKISAECGEKEFTVTGVLPKGTTLSVERCNDSAYKDAVVDLEGKEHFCDADVYDISLKDANGKEFEPGRNVNVTFADAEENLDNSESVSVYHFEGDDADRAEKLRVRRAGEDAVVKTNSFSKFAVVRRAAAVKTVTLDTGNNINKAMQALNADATAIIFTRTAPASGVTTKDISSGGGVVAYLDGSTINIYVPATYEKASLSYNSVGIFKEMSKVTKIQFNDLIDTSAVTTMHSMFSGCSSLTSLNVTNFDTSKVTDMSMMFEGCTKLSTLDVSKFNTANVTEMYSMFSGCSSLTSLNVTNFDTSKVTSMYKMFSGCSSLTSLNVTNFDTSKVTSMYSMFSGCSSLTSLNVTNFDTSKVKTMYSMFSGCSSLTSLNVTNFDTSQVKNMSMMFEGCTKLSTLDVSKFNTANVTEMYKMFRGCSSLTSLNVTNFDTSKVTAMYSMFEGCMKLSTLDVSKFNTANVTYMYSMFQGCSSLTSLNVTNFDTSKVTNMYSMFSGCSSLTSLNVTNFDTSNVTTMYSMFSGCSSLTSLNVTNFDTSKVTIMYSMFSGCSSLTSLNITNFDTSNVTRMSGMLPNNLRKIELGSSFIVPADATNVFPSPTTTYSGKASNGKWGLGSEKAAATYSAADLATKGQTKGALAGTWYAQTKNYTVHFDANNGSGAMADETFTYDTAQALTANTFTRTGYRFIGWNTDANGNGTPYADQSSVKNLTNSATITLYAQWVKNSYNITYQLNGGTNNSANPTTYNIATSDIKLKDPTKTGYTFLYWTLDGDTTNKQYTSADVAVAQKSTGNKSFTAHWKVNQYTVTCEDWLVDASNNKKVKLGSSAKSMNYGTTANGTVWGTDGNRSTYYNGYVYKSATSATVGTSGATVYRYFWLWTNINIYNAEKNETLNAATFSLSSDGGKTWKAGYKSEDTFTVNDVIKPYGTTFVIKDLVPVNSYEEYDHCTNATYSNGRWTYTATAGSNSGISSGPETDRKNQNSINIYLRYKTYSVSYNLNGGSVTGNPTSYAYNTADFTLKNPTRAGYTFTGWTGSNGTTAQTTVTVPKGSYGNKSYTANWKANTNTKYTVIHQQEQLDGTYKTVETQNLTGTTDTKVTPAVKSYTGFTSPATQTVNIAGAGNTVVTYKYARNTYTITRQYRLENADGTFTGYTQIDSKKYKYGASIAAWNRAADTTYKAASIAAYTVTTKNDTLSVNVMRNTSTNNAIQYRLQNADGSYPSTYTAAWSGTLRYGESHTWNYAQTASHQATSKAVSYNGGTVNVNVPRRTGRLVIHANGGTGDRNTTAILYGASDKINPMPSRTGYTLTGLYTAASGGTKVVNADGTMPNDGTYSASGAWKLNSDVNVYAQWTVNQYTVTCEDWFVDASNNRKVKLGSSTKQMAYGTTASGTAWGADGKDSKYHYGYVYKSATSATVGTSGATVYRYFWAWTDLNVYYAGGTTQGGATVSFKVGNGTWTDVTNEINTVQPYGITYYLKNIRPIHEYEEFSRVENLTYDSTNGYYTYTPTYGGTSMNVYLKYKTYSLTYNLNGGSVSGNPTTYNYSTASFTLKNPTRAGYTFTGWTGSNGTTAQTTVTVHKGSYGNKTYTAHFIKTIILTQKHGTSTTSQSYTLTDSEASHTFTLANTKDSFSGWTFQGWRDSATPGPKQYDPTGTITLSDSKTVYATYAQTQTLTFIDYDGTSKRTSIVTGTAYGNNSAGGVVNQYPILTAPTEGSYTGWTARGWSTGTGAADSVALASGGKISNAMTRTYYGLYQQGVTLTYAANGGTTTPAVQSGTRYFNSNGSSSNPTFTLAAALVRTGYTFTGWSVSAPISATKAAAETITPASGTALIATAQWKALTTKVTLDMQGGKQTATGDSTVSADGSTESFTCTYDRTSYRYLTQIPTKTGYTFQGYFSKPDGAGEQVYTRDGLAMTGSFWSSQIWKYTGSSVTFYACWSANPYTVHFDANTGTGTMKDQTLTYNQNGTLSANAFTKKGYSFTGWTTNADGTGKKFADRDVVSNLVTSGSITLYAQWQKNPYTVTVPKKVQYQNMNAGTVDHTVSIPITVSGDFPGTVSVTSKPDTLTAPDGKTLNMETNSHKSAITFTAGDGTKNDALTITGTARLDKYSGIVQYSVSQTE